jgi:hypothetical protein
MVHAVHVGTVADQVLGDLQVTVPSRALGQHTVTELPGRWIEISIVNGKLAGKECRRSLLRERNSTLLYLVAAVDVRPRLHQQLHHRQIPTVRRVEEWRLALLNTAVVLIVRVK